MSGQRSAASGAVLGLVCALLVVGAGTIAASVLPLPAGLARFVDRRGVPLALAVLLVTTCVGALLGYLEGRLKVR